MKEGTHSEAHFTAAPKEHVLPCPSPRIEKHGTGQDASEGACLSAHSGGRRRANSGQAEPPAGLAVGTTGGASERGRFRLVISCIIAAHQTYQSVGLPSLGSSGSPIAWDEEQFCTGPLRQGWEMGWMQSHLLSRLQAHDKQS